VRVLAHDSNPARLRSGDSRGWYRSRGGPTPARGGHVVAVVVDVVDVVVPDVWRPSTSRPSAPACRRIGGGAVSDVIGATATAPAKTVCKTRRTIGGAPPRRATRRRVDAHERDDTREHRDRQPGGAHARESQHAVRTT